MTLGCLQRVTVQRGRGLQVASDLARLRAVVEARCAQLKGAAVAVPMTLPLARNCTLAMVPSGSVAVAARPAAAPVTSFPRAYKSTSGTAAKSPRATLWR